MAVADDVTRSIVEISTTYQEPSWSRPWQMRNVSSKGGSGCVLEGGRILTNAHVVSDQTLIQVRRAGTADKFFAEVEAVSHELDLALLRVADERFFAGARPLSIGDLPRIGDDVVAYGFPEGGTRVTITRGVVSRIERQRYVHSGHSNLVCQIDAAINSGSSGGPVLDAEGRIVGVAFQTSQGENVGFVVPAPIVRHFMRDIADGRIEGTPLLPIRTQDLENRNLREFVGLKAGQSGLLVRNVMPGGTAFLPRDVMLGFEGHEVGNDGTIELRPGERVSVLYAADRKQVGDHVSARVLRDGKIVELDVPLASAKARYPYLVPRFKYETRPTYYVFGGLVFSPLVENYYQAFSGWSRIPERLRRFWWEPRTGKNAWRKQVVVCINVLPDRLNAGYEWAEDYAVASVNGKRIGSMQDLIAAFEAYEGPYHRVFFEPDEREVVLARDAAAERSPKILERYGVDADRSPDLAGKPREPATTR